MPQTKRQCIIINRPDGRVTAGRLKPGETFESFCKLMKFKHPEIDTKTRYKKVRSIPTLKTLNKWMMDGVAKATDGCRVEPDGECQHGHKSWLLVLGVI
jgi:hypothetical protein